MRNRIKNDAPPGKGAPHEAGARIFSLAPSAQGHSQRRAA